MSVGQVLCIDHVRWSAQEEFLPKAHTVHSWGVGGCTHTAFDGPGAPTIHTHRCALSGWSTASPRAPPGLQEGKDKDNSGTRRACTPCSSQLQAQSPPGDLVSCGPDLVSCLHSEEPPLDLTGKVHQLEVMLKQLHTDLQKVRPLGSPLRGTCCPVPPSGHWGRPQRGGR